MQREEQFDLGSERLGLLLGIDPVGPALDDLRATPTEPVDRLGQRRAHLTRHGAAAGRTPRRPGSPQAAAAAMGQAPENGAAGPPVTRSAVRRSAADRASGPIVDKFGNWFGSSGGPGTWNPCSGTSTVVGFSP